ncbi:hypothetical protein [Thermomonospora cellulosilytica]|uniref:Uncharacterized protein n=1 Tax=Thermomonospora cellulosilytica TaxID=1411118 RepID=A0A7W3MWY9_9ACTN|nr:hypothetical protein [Thermomonospora cellulosilytica]MBA9003440.1 hypothetical protein [Thermomonospora cellulosilytica]
METAQHPAQPDGPVGGPPSPLHEQVESAYLPVARWLERLDDGPRLEAVRALLEEQVAGDWSDLAKLLVDPAMLTRPTGPTGTLAVPAVDDPRALFYEDYRLGLIPPADPEPEPEPEPAEPVTGTAEEIVQAALDAPHARLIQAPPGPERTALLADLVRRLAAAGRRTLLLSADRPDDLLDALQDVPAIDADPSSDGPDPLDELVRLRRELLWLEQWPRDKAAVQECRERGERRRTELADEERRLVEAIEAAGERIETAGHRAAEAVERRDQSAEEHRQAAEEAERARSAWRELQAVADAAAREAEERTRAADAAEARHMELTGQVRSCEQELQAARDREAQVKTELAQAEQALPQAERETEQLAAAAAEATAAQHASYYRLAAAESAHSAAKRKLNWGQRLHVAPQPREVDEARRLVKSRRREAEETAERARVAVEAHQHAEALRAGLVRFIEGSRHELVSLAQTQERLRERLASLTAARDTAYTEMQRLARESAGAVDQATETLAAARHAAQVAAEAEAHAAEALRAAETAAAELAAAETEAAEARDRLAALESDLERHRTAATAELADLETELTTFTEAEERSRRHVREICDADPADDLLARCRQEHMTRIEDLSSRLEATLLVHATYEGFPQGPHARTTVFDTLLALDADRTSDPDLLVGAVRTHHWILVADGQGRPPLPQDADDTPAPAPDRLTQSAFERCLTAAPALCHILTTEAEGHPAEDPTPPTDTEPSRLPTDDTAHALPPVSPNVAPSPTNDDTAEPSLEPTSAEPDTPSPSPEATLPLPADPTPDTPAANPAPPTENASADTPHPATTDPVPTPDTPTAGNAPVAEDPLPTADATRALQIVPPDMAQPAPDGDAVQPPSEVPSATPDPAETPLRPSDATIPLSTVPTPAAATDTPSVKAVPPTEGDTAPSTSASPDEADATTAHPDGTMAEVPTADTPAITNGGTLEASDGTTKPLPPAPPLSGTTTTGPSPQATPQPEDEATGTETRTPANTEPTADAPARHPEDSTSLGGTATPTTDAVTGMDVPSPAPADEDGDAKAAPPVPPSGSDAATDAAAGAEGERGGSVVSAQADGAGDRAEGSGWVGPEDATRPLKVVREKD